MNGKKAKALRRALKRAVGDLPERDLRGKPNRDKPEQFTAVHTPDSQRFFYQRMKKVTK